MKELVLEEENWKVDGRGITYSWVDASETISQRLDSLITHGAAVPVLRPFL